MVENAIGPIARGERTICLPDRQMAQKGLLCFLLIFGSFKKKDLNLFEWLLKLLKVIPKHKLKMLHQLLPHYVSLQIQFAITSNKYLKSERPK